MDRNVTGCPSCDVVALPRMWCEVCFEHSLPERKFTKKERKGSSGSGVCVKCKGVVGKFYADKVGKRRKPSNTLKKRSRQEALELARKEVCPGYSAAVEALEEGRAEMMVLVEVRREIRALFANAIPAELIREVESYVLKLCNGPHCERAEWRWPVLRGGTCFNCTLCVRAEKSWFPRVTEDPNPTLEPRRSQDTTSSSRATRRELAKQRDQRGNPPREAEGVAGAMSATAGAATVLAGSAAAAGAAGAAGGAGGAGAGAAAGAAGAAAAGAAGAAAAAAASAGGAGAAGAAGAAAAAGPAAAPAAPAASAASAAALAPATAIPTTAEAEQSLSEALKKKVAIF